jgi:hypothetical protein
MNDDADIWAAFASTPPYREPVANRDNSLAGFQRRLLEECGYKLEQAVEALKEGREIVKEQAAALDELRSRYEALFDRAATAQQIIRDTHATLYRLAATSNVGGLSETITILEAWLDG